MRFLRSRPGALAKPEPIRRLQATPSAAVAAILNLFAEARSLSMEEAPDGLLFQPVSPGHATSWSDDDVEADPSLSGVVVLSGLSWWEAAAAIVEVQRDGGRPD